MGKTVHDADIHVTETPQCLGFLLFILLEGTDLLNDPDKLHSVLHKKCHVKNENLRGY